MRPIRPPAPEVRAEMIQSLVDALYNRPDAESVSQLIDFASRQDPETHQALCEALAARLAATQSLDGPLDLNAAVLDPHFLLNGKEMVLIHGKSLGCCALSALPEVQDHLQAGDQVALKSTDHGVVVAQRIGPYPPSSVKRVERVLLESNRLIVSDHGGEKQVVTMGHNLRGHADLEPGMDVFCASEVSLALDLQDEAQNERTAHVLEDIPLRSLDDLGGQPRARRELKRMLALMTTPKESLAAFGLSRSQLVMFVGPPGTGKTYAALILASLLKQDFKVAVVFVKGPEFLNPLVGASEAAVRGLFESLSRLATKNDIVYVVWDEFESLFRSRGKRISSTMVDDTLVPTLLAEVDGLAKGAMDNVWLAAISNKPELLDGAVVREGRLGQKINFTTLNEAGVEEVAAVHLRGRILAGDIDPHLAAERMAAYAFNGLDGQGLPVAEIRLHDGRRERVTSQQVLTGAMIKGSIDRGAERAWWRWQNGGARGIQVADLFAGLEQAATAIPLSRDNLDEYLGWPLDDCARVVEVQRFTARSR